MADASLDWTQTSFKRGVSGLFVWLVHNAANANDALSAPPIPGNLPIIQKGGTHPYDTDLLADEPEVDNAGGPRTWIIRVRFAPKTTPLPPYLPGQKPKQAWRSIQTIESVDFDANNNPITNSSREPHATAPTKRFNIKSVTVIVRQDSYSVPLALDYENTLNSNEFNFLGQGIVKAAQVCCTSIEPTHDFEEGQKVDVAYSFEAAGYIGLASDGTPISYFDWRLRDEGSRAWDGATSKWLPIVYVTGKEPTKDVLLEGHGKPFDLASFRVLSTGGTIVVPTSTTTPTGAGLDVRASAVWLVWQKYPRKNFAGIGIF